MDEYIKREAVIDLITRRYENPEICTQEINSIPVADVAPVVHGRWVKIEEHIVLTYNTYSPMTITSETCSECNVRSIFLGRKGYVKDNSCPNCGAKMDLEG